MLCFRRISSTYQIHWIYLRQWLYKLISILIRWRQQQHFFLAKKQGLRWACFGKGKVVYFESECLNVVQDYLYQLKRCKTTNCSKEIDGD